MEGRSKLKLEMHKTILAIQKKCGCDYGCEKCEKSVARIKSFAYGNLPLRYWSKKYQPISVKSHYGLFCDDLHAQINTLSRVAKYLIMQNKKVVMVNSQQFIHGFRLPDIYIVTGVTDIRPIYNKIIECYSNLVGVILGIFPITDGVELINGLKFEEII